MFSMHTMLEEFINATITGHFVFEENPSSFLKSSIFKMFSVYTKTQSQHFQIPLDSLKSIFKKLHFCDG